MSRQSERIWYMVSMALSRFIGFYLTCIYPVGPPEGPQGQSVTAPVIFPHSAQTS